MTTEESLTLKRISSMFKEPFSVIMSINKETDKDVLEWIIAAEIAEAAVMYINIGANKSLMAEKLFLDDQKRIKAVLTKEKGKQTIHLLKQREYESLNGWVVKKMDEAKNYYETHYMS